MKTFLFNLSEWLYLISNVMESPGHPMFAETARSVGEQATQWHAIVGARADHPFCHIFDKPADFLAFSLEVPYARERNCRV